MNMKNLELFIKKIYNDDAQTLQIQKKRYNRLIDWNRELFGENDLYLFSTPGRTEIGGNHTDHNNGCVLAGSVNLDSIAAVAKTEGMIVRIYSEGYDEVFEVDVTDLSPKEYEREKTTALIRGIAARFNELGYKIGGFNACITSDVLLGSGLSSSASIEVLIGTIFNVLYNQNEIAPVTVAKIGQFAENTFFGKPCGLMDQIVCAVGGAVSIDFKDPENPVVEQIEFSLKKFGYRLAVVDTDGSHADLTEDYASIPAEMKKVAGYFNKEVCRDITLQDVYANIADLQERFGDRAVLRAMHFLNENKRVIGQVKAIKENDIKSFLKLVQLSGDSSFKFLQNVFTNKAPDEQKISIALALTEDFMEENNGGASRVHGGGFAGTILVFIPENDVSAYREYMEKVFGKNSVMIMSIRALGSEHAKLF